MKKAELEFELRNGYDYNVQKISYHLAKKQDAQNNYIKQYSVSF